MITTSCRIPSGSAPTNAITVLRTRAGQYDRALVVAVGYDDPPGGEFGVSAAVDVLLAEARRQGISHVIWLTYREAGGAGNAERFRQSNAVLRSRTDPELVIADWATRSASMPSSWFSEDGIHLGAQASAAMGELIGDALDGLVPARCTSGVRSGTDVSTGGQVLPVAVDRAPAAVIANVSAVDPSADGFLTLHPCGAATPNVSNVNFVAGATVANRAVVSTGGSSQFCAYSSVDTDVVIDLKGIINAR